MESVRERVLPDSLPAVAALAALSAIAAVGLVLSPLLALGAILGGLLLVVTIVYPLPMLGVMLGIGGVDLSFLTGGFKSLLRDQGGLDMNGIRLIAMVVAIAALAAVERRVERSFAAPSARWYLLFLLYAATTLLYSDSRLDGLRLLLKIAYPLLVFVAVLSVARTRADVDRMADWMLGGAALVALLLNPIYIMFGGVGPGADGWLRVGSFGLHENPFAFYLLTMMLFSFVRFVTRRDVRYLVLCAVLAAWLVATFTRIAFLASALSLLTIGVVGALRTRNYRWLVGGLMLLVALAIPLVPAVLRRTLGFVPTPVELFQLLTHPLALYNAVNWEGRNVLWPLALHRFLAHPVFGGGLGSTTELLRTALAASHIRVVHNEYLRLAAETGVVGILLFGFAVLQWWRVALAAARNLDRSVREFALPALGVLVAWAVISITDNAFDYYAPFTQYVAFFCAGAIVALRAADEEQAGAAGSSVAVGASVRSPGAGAREAR